MTQKEYPPRGKRRFERHETENDKHLSYEALLQEGIIILQDAGIEEARLNAWLLLEFTAGISRAWYYAHKEECPGKEKEAAFRELLAKRTQRIPLQYLTGETDFMGFPFYTDSRALIPRQDTEILAETALSILKERKSPQILDMCTGTGCILISLLLLCPEASGTGTDISEDALALAKENALRHHLGSRIQLFLSDLFSNPFFHKNDGKEPPLYDMLISNPPYIASEEIGSLMEEVRFYEPRLALDGGDDGLFFYRRIIAEAGRYLKRDGYILFEIGSLQGEAVSALLLEAGFEKVRMIKDLSGLDRVVCGQKSTSGEDAGV